MNQFRSQTKTLRFHILCRQHDKVPDACRREQDCSVCLSEYAPESEINMLPCGHVCSGICLEKWMAYWNITRPLCRSPFVPEGEEEEGPSSYQ